MSIFIASEQKKILHVKNTKLPSRNSGTLCIFHRRPFSTNFSFQSERYGPKLCSQKLVGHKSRYSRFFMQARFHNKSREIDQNRHKMAKIGFFHSKWGVKSPKKGRKHRKTSPKCSHTIWGSFGTTFDFWSRSRFSALTAFSIETHNQAFQDVDRVKNREYRLLWPTSF